MGQESGINKIWGSGFQTGGEVPDLIPTLPHRSCRRQPESLCPQHRETQTLAVWVPLYMVFLVRAENHV